MLNKNNEKNSFAICYRFYKFELSLTGLKGDSSSPRGDNSERVKIH
jgi:hypothetical protein